jgi:hypothetical protein
VLSDGGTEGARRRYVNCWHGVGHGALLHHWMATQIDGYQYGPCSTEADVHVSPDVFIDASTLCDDFFYLAAPTLGAPFARRANLTLDHLRREWASGCQDGLGHASVQAQVAAEHQHWAFPCVVYQPERRTFQDLGDLT